MLALLVTFGLSDCFRFRKGTVYGNFKVSADACFVLEQGALSGVAVTITLLTYPAGFFGTTTAAVPDNITIVQDAVGPATSLDYPAFTSYVPVFCSKGVTADFLESVWPPESMETDDLRTLDFSLEFDEASEYYDEYFSDGPGNCVLLRRVIREFEDQGVSVGTCVGIILGLLAGGVLCAWCIIYLEPIIKRQQEPAKQENETLQSQPKAPSDEESAEDDP
jgi:hypothetical protein